MIKKAILICFLVPFLMSISQESFAWRKSTNLWSRCEVTHPTSLAGESCRGARVRCPLSSTDFQSCVSGTSTAETATNNYIAERSGDAYVYYVDSYNTSYSNYIYRYTYVYSQLASDYTSNPTPPPGGQTVLGTSYSNDQCQSSFGGTGTRQVSEDDSYGYSAGGGACSVKASGPTVCLPELNGQPAQCSSNWVASSTGQTSVPLSSSDPDSNNTGEPVEFNTPSYLNPLPGACTANSCVTIGDTSYLVDWDTAPEWFEYTDASGNTISGPSGGGDSSGDNSGDNGGGGGSGGGSTVPDFEFDDSGVIAAIGSVGQSQRNAINALSNDVNSAISNQTNDLSSTLNNQTNTLSDSLDDQTGDLTSAIDSQTGAITGSLDSLGSTFTDALNGLGLGDGEGEGEGFLDTLVDKLASTFTEDLGNGDDLFDSTGMDDTLDGVAVQEEQHSDDVNALMDQVGEGATSGIAEQITSRLPSLPSGGCVPLQFGPMEISCQSFNTIKLWLTWIIYFWTVVSIVDIFFRSEQRTA